MVEFELTSIELIRHEFAGDDLGFRVIQSRGVADKCWIQLLSLVLMILRDASSSCHRKIPFKHLRHALSATLASLFDLPCYLVPSMICIVRSDLFSPLHLKALDGIEKLTVAGILSPLFVVKTAQ